MWVGHVLDHVPDHVLYHMIIGLVTTALHMVFEFLLTFGHLNLFLLSKEK